MWKKNKSQTVIALCLCTSLHANRPALSLPSSCMITKKSGGENLVCMPHENGQHYQEYLLGNYELFAGSGPKSFSHYQELLRNNPSPYAYEGFIHLLFATGNYRNIAQMVPVLDTMFKDNLAIQLIFIQSLYESQNPADHIAADQRTIKLQQQFKKSPELTLFAAQAYTKQGNLKQALAVIDGFLNNVSNHPRLCLFYYLKSQLYAQLNNKERAIEQAKKSLELCPRHDQGWLFLGMLLEQQGALEEAISGYRSYLSTVGPNKNIEQQLQRLIVRNKNSPPQKAKKNDRGARLMKLQTLTAAKKTTESLALLQQWMQAEPGDETWYKSLHWMVQAGLHREHAIKVLQVVEQAHPEEKLPFLYLADLYSRAGQFDKALEYHTKALAHADQPQKIRLWYNMGVIYFETERYEKMLQVLNNALKIGSEFPPLNNLLSYYYATKGHDITRAQQLIDKVLKSDPANPHFLDTQAVIWYKQQQFDKAKNLLNQLIIKQPNDYAMHLHLAKIEEKMGNKEQSQKLIARAEQLAHTKREKNACLRIKKLLL